MLLRTLGELSLEGSDFSRPKPLLLLAYLALEGPKPRRYLAELFFMDTKDPYNGLSQALKLLRQNVPGAVEADAQKAWATVACDATELLDLADKGRFEACVELYRGPFAETLNVPLGEELEEWVYGTREYVAGRTRETLLQTAEKSAHEGSYHHGSTFAETAYTLGGAPELEPEQFERIYNLLAAGNNPKAAELREQAHSYGMTLSASSQQAKTRFRVALSEGVAVRNNLPPPKTSFVGREQELRLIADQLANPECRLLTLHGMGGIGKSRLALQAAYEELKKGAFEDGVFFVPLDALSSTELIPASIVEALGFKLQEEDSTTHVKRIIGNQQMLLILDNFEHLLEGALITSELLKACPQLKLIVTSREVLSLEEEWVESLEGLSFSKQPNNSLETARKEAAIDLFLQRAKRIRLDYNLTQDNLPHVLEICNVTEGSPLCLELAATWVGVMTTQEIAKEIEENQNILVSSNINAVERHRSIYAVLEQSWLLLSRQEQKALLDLSLFVGGFSRAAAGDIASVSLTLLSALSKKALVAMSASGRYVQHPLVVQFARAKLAENPQNEARLQEVYVDCFSDLVKRINRYDATFTDVVKTLDSDLANIVNTLKISQHFEVPDKFVALMKSLVLHGPYLMLRGYNPELHRYLDLAASLAHELGDNEACYNLLGRSAHFYQNFVGDFEKAMAYYSKAAERAHGRNSARESVFLSNKATAAARLGLSNAESLMLAAFTLAEDSHDRNALAVVLEQWGYVVAVSGDWKRADELLDRALVYLETTAEDSPQERFENQRRRFFCLLNAGDVKRTLLDFQASLALYEKASTLAHSLENFVWVAHAKYNLGELYLDMGQKEAGFDNLENALEMYKSIGANVYVDVVQSILNKAQKEVQEGVRT